jgi:hypothetical protein
VEAEALRDWEFMKERAQRGTAKDPFILSSKKLPDFLLIKDAMKWFAKQYESQIGGRAAGRLDDRPRDAHGGNEGGRDGDRGRAGSRAEDGGTEDGRAEDGSSADGHARAGDPVLAANAANDANGMNDGRSSSGGNSSRIGAAGIISSDYCFKELTTTLSWQDAEPVGGTRGGDNRRISQDMRLKRVTMALIGGSFLVGPMLLMVLVNTRTASLITSSLCVLAFGLVMAVLLERPFDVLSGTAAYAAVLVVFVGTSLES